MFQSSEGDQKMGLKRNEWWAVLHTHNDEAYCVDGQAAVFETRRKAQAFAAARSRVVGQWNVRVRKVVLRPPLAGVKP